MKTLLWILAIFGLAVALALVAQQDFGYAVLVLPTHRVELSIALFVVLAVGAFIVGYAIVRTAHHAVRLPAMVREHRQTRRETAGRSAFIRAVTAFLDGRYHDANRLAHDAAANHELVEIADRLAAESAKRVPGEGGKAETL